jgi:hypothetical protein
VPHALGRPLLVNLAIEDVVGSKDLDARSERRRIGHVPPYALHPSRTSRVVDDGGARLAGRIDRPADEAGFKGVALVTEELLVEGVGDDGLGFAADAKVEAELRGKVFGRERRREIPFDAVEEVERADLDIDLRRGHPALMASKGIGRMHAR